MREPSSQTARSKIPGSRSIQRSCVSAMSSGLGAKTSKTYEPRGLEEPASRAQRAQLLGLGLHVQQRAEGADDERNAFLHRRLAQVADAEVEQGADAGCVGALAGHREHLRRRVDADHADPRLRDRDGDPPRADGELDDGAAARQRPVDVEADVLGDGPAPRVVEARDPVVQGHAAGFRATQTNSRLSSSNGRRSNHP